MSGLGNLPGPIGIGKGVFGRTAGPSMMANFRSVQTGAVALEFDDTVREMKRRREEDEVTLEAERAAVQDASNVRRDEADLPAVEYETAFDAIKDAFSLLRVQVDALVREREFREQAHSDFKIHFDSTKQAVENAKTDILEGVRRGVEGELVGAVNTLSEAIKGDKTETWATSAKNIEDGLTGKLDRAVEDIEKLLADVPTASGLRSLLEDRPEEGSAAIKELVRSELATVKKLLTDVWTNSSLRSLLERRLEEGPTQEEHVRNELAKIQNLLADLPTSSGLRSLLERRLEEGPTQENPQIIEKLDAFITGHKMEQKIAALHGELREASLIQDKKLLEQKVDFQQEAMKEGTGNLRGLHQEQQLVQKWALENAHLQKSILDAKNKIEGLEALVLSADARMRTEREKLLKDHGKELGRVEAQLAAAAEKIRGLETTAATADSRRKEAVAAEVALATAARENLLKDHGRETGKLEAKIEAAQEKFDAEKKKLEQEMDALRGLLRGAEAKLEQAEACHLEEAKKAETRRIQDLDQASKKQLEEAAVKNSEDIVELQKQFAQEAEVLKNQLREAKEKGAEEVAKIKEQLAQGAEASKKQLEETKEKGAEEVAELKRQFEDEVAAGKKRLEEAEGKNSDDVSELKQQLEQDATAARKKLEEAEAKNANDISELKKQLEQDAAAGKKKLEEEADDLMKKLEEEKVKSAADASEMKKQLEQQAEALQKKLEEEAKVSAKKLDEEKVKSAADAGVLRKLLEQQAEDLVKKLDEERAKSAADASELKKQLNQQAEALEKKLDEEKVKSAADASELKKQLEELGTRRTKEASDAEKANAESKAEISNLRKKVVDHKALRDRLQRVEGWHKKDVEIAKKKLKEAHTVESDLREQLKQAQAGDSALRTKLQEVEADATAAKKAEAEKLQAAEADATAAMKTEVDLRRKLDAVETDLRARLEQAGTDSDALRGKLDAVEKAEAELRVKLQAAETDLRGEAELRVKLQAAETDLRGKLHATEKVEAELRAKLHATEKVEAELRAKIDQQAAAQQTAESELSTARQTHAAELDALRRQPGLRGLEIRVSPTRQRSEATPSASIRPIPMPRPTMPSPGTSSGFASVSPGASTSASASSSPQRTSYYDALMRPPPAPGRRRESNDSEVQRDPKRMRPYESPSVSRAASVVSDTSAQFAPLPLPAETFVPRPVPVPVGTVAVRSPKEMETPVEFIATGGLLDGELASRVCASTVDAISAKIAEWKAKSKWEYPKSKKNLCVYVKGMKVAVPKWPANDYHNPDNGNPEFACPLCVVNRVPCIWTMRGAQARVLPLPPQSRDLAATPQTPGFYLEQ